MTLKEPLSLTPEESARRIQELMRPPKPNLYPEFLNMLRMTDAGFQDVSDGAWWGRDQVFQAVRRQYAVNPDFRLQLIVPNTMLTKCRMDRYRLALPKVEIRLYDGDMPTLISISDTQVRIEPQITTRNGQLVHYIVHKDDGNNKREIRDLIETTQTQFEEMWQESVSLKDIPPILKSIHSIGF